MAAPAQAKAQPQPQLKINILRPQGVPQQLPTRFFGWMFSYGRFIVIVVEIIVLACFAYRFKLDADLATLKQDIDTEVKKIQSRAPDEALIKQTQEKLLLIEQIDSNSPTWQQFMKDISDRTPKGVQLTSFTIEHAQNSPALAFKLSGETSTHLDVAGFVSNLSGKNVPDDQKKFSSVELQSFSFDQGVLHFVISGATK